MWLEMKDIDPVQKPVKLPPRQLYRLSFTSTWPRKPMLLQPLVPQHEAIALPVQNLELVPLAIAEHEQLCAERVELQGVFHEDR